MKIAILGAGAFGTALGGILADKGYDIDYYDSRLERESLSDVVASAEYVVLCVPSKAAPHVLPYLPKDKPLIVATKGILSDKAFISFDDYMVLSGPGFADDIKAAKKTKLTATDERIEGLFGTGYLTFDRTDDRLGVLMCGALKNVYAILAGLLNLVPGTKKHENFLKAVEEEMRALLLANGAEPKTVELVCGKGDLRLTCALPSRNYEFGLLLSRDPDARPEKTVEGISALKRVKRGEIKVPQTAKKLRELMEMSGRWA
ncbi:hypothetical protein [Candidatus Nanosyncoccus alces]|uniref:Glycerol-3-phosphate dehydrogenase [NAD(P)+] n=1 Tax=Candidatus Nanosyncoccus alces TaxID=2171997 RepID=A0ABY0FKW1_9BACT|nr:hypothetical protein [Candidatus Nanosyncoccus alces]RYC74396.1 Glycerol-3-phosphate dehydrogenase [NAD(P)+] [Candidatus Nanosyncoccus alces]